MLVLPFHLRTCTHFTGVGWQLWSYFVLFDEEDSMHVCGPDRNPADRHEVWDSGAGRKMCRRSLMLMGQQRRKCVCGPDRNPADRHEVWDSGAGRKMCRRSLMLMGQQRRKCVCVGLTEIQQTDMRSGIQVQEEKCVGGP